MGSESLWINRVLEYIGVYRDIFVHFLCFYSVSEVWEWFKCVRACLEINFALRNSGFGPSWVDLKSNLDLHVYTGITIRPISIPIQADYHTPGRLLGRKKKAPAARYTRESKLVFPRTTFWRKKRRLRRVTHGNPNLLRTKRLKIQ